MSVAKSVAENYEDQELRDTFINISLDLYVYQIWTCSDIPTNS